MYRSYSGPHAAGVKPQLVQKAVQKTVPNPVSNPVQSPLSGSPAVATGLSSAVAPGSRAPERELLPGRSAQQEQLRDYLSGSRAIQLLGEARMGRSTTLQWVSRLLEHEGRSHVLLDANQLPSPTAYELVRGIARALGREDSVARILRDGNQSGVRAFQEALELLTPCVVLIDNADAFAQGAGFPSHFFVHWRLLNEKGNSAGKLVWVSAARQCLFQRFKAGGQSCSFFNDAPKVWLGAIEPEIALKLLEGQVAGGRDRASPLPPNTLNQAMAVTGGFADGLLWLGERLSKSPEKLDELSDQFRETFWPTFQTWWQNRSSLEQDILLTCARERLDARGLKRQDRRQERQTTRRLESLGLLAEQNGHFVLPGYAWRAFVAANTQSSSH